MAYSLILHCGTLYLTFNYEEQFAREQFAQLVHNSTSTTKLFCQVIWSHWVSPKQYVVYSNVCYIISFVCAVSDINECDLNTHNCSNNAECFNTNGSFVCNCSVGFSGNGVLCEGMKTTKFPLD